MPHKSYPPPAPVVDMEFNILQDIAAELEDRRRKLDGVPIVRALSA